jgi:tRNA uridine 5-carboxymethylaminomethyl modification enzyme
MRPHYTYDVAVIGAGHAGVEAALAAARIGCKTLLLTGNLDTIGQMSCNPAIGGIGKGHLVREIDALGGQMGRCADQSGINFRLLNTRKGSTVQSPRVQCDKKAYQFNMKSVVERTDNLTIRQGVAENLQVHDGAITGIETTTGTLFHVKAVVITAGTFFRGVAHIGSANFASGRAGDPPSVGLSRSIEELGVKVQRLKTGTPPRILGATIDFESMECQHGDETPSFLSFSTPQSFHVEQVPCHITTTTRKTVEVVTSNIHLSALYSGRIKGTGPRYCPSIEDKVVKFPDKLSQQVFIEPEGRETNEYYINGTSTSLPESVQVEFIRTINGLEIATLARPAYAIEYDFFPPHQLHRSLESKVVNNLFFAGQVNGSSGYEEAAAQGLIAGINAAMKVGGLDPIIIDRNQGYIGVLIDDLVSMEILEPYRIFTSRAEHRLSLGFHDADLRLTPVGRRIGLVCDGSWSRFKERKRLIEDEVARLKATRSGIISCFEMLRRPNSSYCDLSVANQDLPPSITQVVENMAKYEWYIERDKSQIEKRSTMADVQIPNWIDYSKIHSLKTEAIVKLDKIRPDTITQASRIQGVTAADLSILAVWLKKHYSSERITS